MSEEKKERKEKQLSDEQLNQVSGGLKRGILDDLMEEAKKNANVDGKFHENTRYKKY